MCNVFFLIGFLRSGTTAYAKILNTASNAEVFAEQSPRLRIESRELIKGNLADPGAVLLAKKSKPIHDILQKGLKYGDKNICYMPFVPYLVNIWDCQIIFLVRDGREVVRSLMDWHELKAHNIYVMQEDDENSTITLPEEDPWDYSRLRPEPGDPLFKRWKKLSRFQKCAWYWETFNAMALDKLSEIDPAKWMMVDVSHANEETIKSIFDFLELEGFNASIVSEMLSSRINSVPDRTQNEDKFPKWSVWTAEQKQIFDEFASSMMVRLHYY